MDWWTNKRREVEKLKKAVEKASNSCKPKVVPEENGGLP